MKIPALPEAIALLELILHFSECNFYLFTKFSQKYFINLRKLKRISKLQIIVLTHQRWKKPEK
jgi:hypothetical protein